jgi:hypothetical protein
LNSVSDFNIISLSFNLPTFCQKASWIFFDRLIYQPPTAAKELTLQAAKSPLAESIIAYVTERPKTKQGAFYPQEVEGGN